jgi:TolA-binding protein
MSRTHFRLLPLVAFALLLVPATSAHAANKDMIELQTQIKQLQDAVARLQQSNDERMGAMKDLMLQTADSVNKMSVQMNGVKLSLQNQQEAVGAKTDQISGQVQSLNDSIDELKARMVRIEKALGDIQSQQQSANAILTNMPAGGGAPLPATGPAPITRSPVGSAPSQKQNQPQSDNNSPFTDDSPQAAAPPAAAGPAVGDMYRTAYSDYMSAKYPLATSEFNDLIKAYPDDNLSGTSYFYMGEIALRTQKPTLAVKNYDHLLERYPDNTKIPAAHLHKAEALLSMKQNENGIRELRALIQRFPNSPEAAQARQKLTSLHAAASPS